MSQPDPLPDPGRFAVRSVGIAPPGALLDLAAAPDDRIWLRGGQGFVGSGVAAAVSTRGPDRFALAHRWWRRLCDLAEVDDAVGLPGSGPVALGSFGFAGSPDSPGELVVPRSLVAHRDGRWWRTTVTPLGAPDAGTPAPAPVRDHGTARVAGGTPDAGRWSAAVAEAVRRIRAGELGKVVLARRVEVAADGPVDPRLLLRRLAAGYPGCWGYSAAGLVGATPELLVRREGDHVTSRVLAGTVRSTGDPDRDAAALAASGKDLGEHRYAVRSVEEVLGARCRTLRVPAGPRPLRLANVVHLATDVTGEGPDGDALQLAAALHPSAAVCGTPTGRAARLIPQLEGFDRDRYAGPVGWVSAAGDGEWGIALRGGILAPDRCRVHLYAGCGIVAGSRPELELDETEAKLLPMLGALGVPPERTARRDAG